MRFFIWMFTCICLFSSGRAQDLENKEEPPAQLDNSQTLKSKTNEPKTVSSQNNEKNSDEVNTEFSVEIVSDFIFRGQSFGGEPARRRNNTSYQPYTDAWAIQPYIEYSAPLAGLKFLLWGNTFLQHSTDRDRDRYLQTGPGERNLGDTLQTQLAQTGRLLMPESDLDYLRMNLYKEKNGLHRQNGVFLGGFYEWNTKFGQWSVGTWFWNNADRAARFTWQEYFVWYKPKLLPFLNPMISVYFNSSSDNGGSNSNPAGITNGQNYISLDLSHVFRDKKFFRITPSFHTGYLVNNDNINKKSGISNITSGLKFNFGALFTTLNWIHRPDVALFDIEDSNNRDSRTPNPSKQYGIHGLVHSEFNRRFTQQAAAYLGEQYSSQAIVKNLYYISFGYETKF